MGKADDNIDELLKLTIVDKSAEARKKKAEAQDKTSHDEEQLAKNQEKEEEVPTLKEVLRKQATEDDLPFSKNLSLSKILGGDILNTKTIRNQIWVVVLVAVFIFMYIANRYSVQKDMIEIDRLQKELVDAKYRALSSNSQITERSRESRVLELLKTNEDSVLKIPNQPPYIIHVPDNE
jgi:cell division protein FtsL